MIDLLARKQEEVLHLSLPDPVHNMTDIITAHGLQKSYIPGAEVLRNVSLCIKTRERVALVGANGSGKSTLLKLLIGLTAPNAGTVTAFGEPLPATSSLSQKRRVRRQIGYVFQSHGLVGRASVLSNVVHGMLGLPGGWRAITETLAPEDWRNRAMAALQDVKLADKAEARADQLSGGQAQRVAIARALIRRPKLMIADEPAASLDPAAGHDVMRVFSDLASAQKISMIYTTHDMDHARNYSDRIVALKNGEIILNHPSSSLCRKSLDRVFS